MIHFCPSSKTKRTCGTRRLQSPPSRTNNFPPKAEYFTTLARVISPSIFPYISTRCAWTETVLAEAVYSGKINCFACTFGRTYVYHISLWCHLSHSPAYETPFCIFFIFIDNKLFLQVAPIRTCMVKCYRRPM